MAKRKEVEHTCFSITEKGISIQLPKSNDLSPCYSRRQLKDIIADLQAVFEDDLWAAWRTELRERRSLTKQRATRRGKPRSR